MDSQKQSRKKKRSTTELDNFWRASFIDAATVIEEQISRCIAWHYCENEEKHLEFIALLFNRGEVPFSKKIEIFEFLFKAHYSDLHKALPNLITRTNSLRRLRNKFAHSEFVKGEGRKKARDGTLIRYLNRDGKMIDELISFDDIANRHSDSYGLMTDYLYLTFEFKHRAKGGKPHRWVDLWDVVEGRNLEAVDVTDLILPGYQPRFRTYEGLGECWSILVKLTKVTKELCEGDRIKYQDQIFKLEGAWWPEDGRKNAVDLICLPIDEEEQEERSYRELQRIGVLDKYSSCKWYVIEISKIKEDASMPPAIKDKFLEILQEELDAKVKVIEAVDNSA